MANTYTQINIQLVFAVEERAGILAREWSAKLYAYMAGIIKKLDGFPLAINGYRDHVHVFFELSPTVAVSHIAKEVKRSSTDWINENKLVMGRFRWQEGYSAFSYSRSQRPQVIEYINNQEQHHHKTSFRDEYIQLLENFQIEYDEKYVFRFPQ